MHSFDIGLDREETLMRITTKNRKHPFGFFLAFGTLFLGVSALPVGAQKESPRATTGAGSVGAPDWKTLQAPYAYDVHQKPMVKTEEKANANAYLLHIEFNGPDGEKVTGLYARPKREGVYPCILLLHGWTSKKDDMAAWIGPEIVGAGMSFLALDAPRHGERAKPGAALDFATMWQGVTVQGIRDYRMAMLWLADRKDVDNKHIGLFGYSMGSMMGSVLCGLDNRLQAAALCVGGDLFIHHISELPADKRAIAYTMSPSLFIGHFAPRPVLLLNGKQDQTVKEEASTALFAAAKEPKQQIMFNAGHILPKEALVTGVNWLAEKIKPRSDAKRVTGTP